MAFGLRAIVATDRLRGHVNYEENYVKLILKIVVFAAALVVVLVIFAMFGMPGMRDGELHLAGNYYFTFAGTGGYQNSITEAEGENSTYAIPMKVEEFLVHGDAIFLSRRPVISKNTGQNTERSWLGNDCEYYWIDWRGRVVHGPFDLAAIKNDAKWAFLKEQPLDKDFGKTLCKLDAVRK